MSKYDDDQPFSDPVVRCTECQKLLFREDIQAIGKCKYCGCRKVRSLDVLKDSEMKLMKNKQVDPEYLELFGPMEIPNA